MIRRSKWFFWFSDTYDHALFSFFWFSNIGFRIGGGGRRRTIEFFWFSTSCPFCEVEAARSQGLGDLLGNKIGFIRTGCTFFPISLRFSSTVSGSCASMGASSVGSSRGNIGIGVV